MVHLPNVAPRLGRFGVRAHLTAEEIPQPAKVHERPLPWAGAETDDRAAGVRTAQQGTGEGVARRVALLRSLICSRAWPMATMVPAA